MSDETLVPLAFAVGGMFAAASLLAVGFWLSGGGFAVLSGLGWWALWLKHRGGRS